MLVAGIALAAAVFAVFNWRALDERQQIVT